VNSGTVATTAAIDVLEAAELQDVRYLEISARVIEEDDTERGEARAPLIQLMYRNAPGSLHARAVLRALGADLSLTIDALAHFTWAGGQEPSEEAIESFVLHTCTSVLYPYLRTAAADMTQRLGAEPLLLPFFKPGSIRAESLEIEGATPQVKPRQKGSKRVSRRVP
jgi:hypothetical protein